jgi:hypothetical protein
MMYFVSGTIRCLFSDNYKTHKYSVGRAYSCWMLNCWCITWPVGCKSLMSDTQVSHPDKITSKFFLFYIYLFLISRLKAEHKKHAL